MAYETFHVQAAHLTQNSDRLKLHNKRKQALFKGVMLTRAPQSRHAVLNAMEELSANYRKSQLGSKMKGRKARASSSNLAQTAEEVEELIEKIPKMKKGQEELLKTMKEIFSEQNISSDLVLKKISKLYKDPSLQYLAIKSLINRLDKLMAKAKGKGDTRQVTRLSSLLHFSRQALRRVIVSTSRKNLLAGINVADSAFSFAEEADIEEAESLIVFYRDAVLNYDKLTSAYTDLLKRFGEQGFQSGIDYLLSALSADLAAKGSSIDKANLKAINDDITSLRSLQNIFTDTLKAIILFVKLDRIAMMGVGHEIIRELMIIQKRRSVSERFLDKIANSVNVFDMERKIKLFMRVMNLIRTLPVKLFMDDQSREQIINDIQDVLDDVIYEYEEEGD